jgi:transcriptional regulator with XRE-family HTH domain
LRLALPRLRDMDPSERFAANLRKAREARGLSQEGLAQAADLHWTQVGRIERNVRGPTFKTIIKLARGLGVPPGKLFDGIE